MEAEKIMTKERVDFHVHYTDETARDIIREAKNKGVVAVGLVGRAEYSTRIPEFMQYGKDYGVKVLPGVEYKARLDQGGYGDIICLGFDPNHPDISIYFAEEGQKQQQINREVAAKEKEFLEAQGFSLDNLNNEDKNALGEILRGEHAEKAIKLCRIAVNTQKDYVEELKKKYPREWQEVQERHGVKPWYRDDPNALSAKFLYELYFADDSRSGFKYAIEPYITPASKIIEATHKAGGVVLYSPEGKFNMDAWQKLVDLGVDGIMGWHANRIELPKSLVTDIRKQGLLILGGGDYDPTRNHWQIGSGDETNSMFISPKRYQELENYKRMKGLTAA